MPLGAAGCPSEFETWSFNPLRCCLFVVVVVVVVLVVVVVIVVAITVVRGGFVYVPDF